MARNGRPVHTDTLRMIKRLGVGSVFQTIDVRQKLGYGKTSPEAHYMHSVIQRLKTDLVIETTGPERKRHQYLTVANEDELNRRVDRAIRGSSRTPVSTDAEHDNDDVTEPAPTNASAPRRVIYLEDRVSQLEGLVPTLHADHEELSSKVDGLAKQVEDLVRLWS